MKKQLLNEINEMKYLFGYKRGVVISEQPVNPPSPAPSTPPATTNTTPAPSTPPSPAPVTSTTATAAPSSG
jgi:hypothetical protein